MRGLFAPDALTWPLLQLTGKPSGRLRLWRDGYRYSKAGLMTFHLTAASLKDVGLTEVIKAAIDEYVHQGG